jgi:hypothetical protein
MPMEQQRVTVLERDNCIAVGALADRLLGRLRLAGR